MPPPSQLPPCGFCRRSAWAHVLRGPYLYCDAIGGNMSTHTEAQVNILRATLGKPPCVRRIT